MGNFLPPSSLDLNGMAVVEPDTKIRFSIQDLSSYTEWFMLPVVQEADDLRILRTT
ncbi:hypothetical protein WG66_013598 [Moniliophthora roreri]|nr:hypothetical protein WG66_013598 [Moniliophthora roreri]